MPLATPITEALSESPLDAVVTALAEIETLARLAERGVAHCDIKPGNLYHRDDRWLIGDFGLVAAPDRAELTRSGKPLGPAHYTANEMTLDPVNADPLPADVYSFGKTLYVLATRQTYQPDGWQPASTRRFSIAELRPHPHAAALDRLVDRATLLHADQRPTMRAPVHSGCGRGGSPRGHAGPWRRCAGGSLSARLPGWAGSVA